MPIPKKPEKKVKYIVAGTYHQAKAYAEQQLLNSQLFTYKYVANPDMLRGRIFPPEDVIFTGNYWEHKQFRAICDQLNHVHKTWSATRGIEK